MIDKLYKMKEQQINQQVVQKQQLISKVEDLDIELSRTIQDLKSATVNVMGAISDFRVLEIHKATMKDKIVQLGQQKLGLLQQIDQYDQKIIALNRESEQFNYILQEQKKEKLKEINKQEELIASEYMQVKFIEKQKVS